MILALFSCEKEEDLIVSKGRVAAECTCKPAEKITSDSNGVLITERWVYDHEMREVSYTYSSKNQYRGSVNYAYDRNGFISHKECFSGYYGNIESIHDFVNNSKGKVLSHHFTYVNSTFEWTDLWLYDEKGILQYSDHQEGEQRVHYTENYTHDMRRYPVYSETFHTEEWLRTHYTGQPGINGDCLYYRDWMVYNDFCQLQSHHRVYYYGAKTVHAIKLMEYDDLGRMISYNSMGFGENESRSDFIYDEHNALIQYTIQWSNSGGRAVVRISYACP